MSTFQAEQKQFYTIAEMLASGLSHYKIEKLVRSGQLVKLNNKVYEDPNFNGEQSDFSRVAVYVPKGRICMLSAARYYGLTNYLPDAVDIAIERSMKISTFPDHPSIHVWYFPQKRYSSGVAEVQDEAGKFLIYDREKTVADILYYRNTVGIEETKEVLKNYLASEDRNMVRLHRYAEALGCRKILETYLEVLI